MSQHVAEDGNHNVLYTQLILDFSKENNLRVRRVSNLNVSAGGGGEETLSPPSLPPSLYVLVLPILQVALVQHYSILEFPSAVVELSRGQHHVIPG